MPYRIGRRESVREAVGRVVAEELDAGRREASDRRRSLDDRVHALRLRLKRARAALRLVRGGGGALRRQERALRDLGRSLAAARDAAIARGALRALGVRARWSRPRAKDAVELADGLRALERLRRRARDVDVPHAGRVARRAFARDYGRARRWLETSGPGDAAARFHAWRKIVKRLALQARLFERVAPDVSRALRGPLDDLAERLGALHDLAILDEKLASGREVVLLGVRRPDTLRARLRDRQQKERARARALGTRVLAMPSGELRERLRREWRDR